MAGNKVDGNGNVTQVERVTTNASVSIPIEVFERKYLSPQMPSKGDNYKRLGNPAPYCLIGFLLASTPLASSLMGWRGAAGAGSATIGFSYFFGGLLQIIGSVFECIMGNTFTFAVFGSFGAFFLAFGATQQPNFNAQAFFTNGAQTAAEEEAGLAEFYSSFAFALLSMAILVTIYTICSLRTNVVFFFIFFVLDVCLLVFTGSYWCLAEGKTEVGEKLLKTAGALLFAICIAGWYLLFHLLLESVDFPLRIPVGDLSHRFKGASARGKGPEVEV